MPKTKFTYKCPSCGKTYGTDVQITGMSHRCPNNKSQSTEYVLVEGEPK